VRYAGAAYLVYLGVRRLLGRGDLADASAGRPVPRRRVFSRGVLVNVLNPKTALFFYSFLPQFVDVEAGRVGAQMMVFGLVFVAVAWVSDSLWGLAAGTAGTWLRGNRRVLRAERYASGGLLVGLGVTAALAGHRKP
jgi:threonine/homoserine/homoserine lactone efflux protein